jgi:hypothetical protein
VRREGLGQLNLMASGIEFATFWFVAYCVNACYSYLSKYINVAEIITPPPNVPNLERAIPERHINFGIDCTCKSDWHVYCG